MPQHTNAMIVWEMVCDLGSPSDTGADSGKLIHRRRDNIAGVLRDGGGCDMPYLLQIGVVLHGKKPALVEMVWQVVLVGAAAPHAGEIHDWPC